MIEDVIIGEMGAGIVRPAATTLWVPFGDAHARPSDPAWPPDGLADLRRRP
jgi:hypothetical protein